MIPERTDDELNQIAIDWHHGHIFSDLHCDGPEEVRNTFAVFLFMNQQEMRELKADSPGLVFEHLSKAGPLAVNGKPMFFSHQYLSKPDTVKLFAKIKLLYDAMSNALKSA